MNMQKDDIVKNRQIDHLFLSIGQVISFYENKVFVRQFHGTATWYIDDIEIITYRAENLSNLRYEISEVS